MFRVVEGKVHKKDAKGEQSAAFLDTAGLTVEKRDTRLICGVWCTRKGEVACGIRDTGVEALVSLPS